MKVLQLTQWHNDLNCGPKFLFFLWNLFFYKNFRGMFPVENQANISHCTYLFFFFWFIYKACGVGFIGFVVWINSAYVSFCELWEGELLRENHRRYGVNVSFRVIYCEKMTGAKQQVPWTTSSFEHMNRFWYRVTNVRFCVGRKKYWTSSSSLISSLEYLQKCQAC